MTAVDSCPTSKTEWDAAARKKDCGRLASKQNCTTVEKFQYHCVVNGLRSKLLEVCAPTRIIFGHCVEFNVRGGVIQDQISAPCNAEFPKCANFYNSSEVYKYSDCYKLVLKNDGPSLEQKTTTPKDTLKTTHESGHMKPIYIILIILLIVIPPVAVFLALHVLYKRICRKPLCHSQQHNVNHMEKVLSKNENDEGGVQYIYIRKESSNKSEEEEEKKCLIPKNVDDEKDIQHSSSDQSLSRCFSKSESAVNNIQYSSLNQRMRQPVDQDIRQRKSTQSMSQRFARSDSAAYNKGYKASYFI